MTAAIRYEVAIEKVAGLPDERLTELLDLDELWDLSMRVGVGYTKLKKLIRREQLKRGLLKPTDMTPEERRELVDPANLDLKAIAAGPIMDIGQIYLPAGKLSMAETRAREQSNILPDEGV